MRFFTHIFFVLLGVLGTHQIHAQELIKRTCATHDIVNQYLLDNFTPDQLRVASPFARAANDTTYSVPVVNSDSTYTIQVVVHVVYLNDNKYENPSDAIIQSQIDALNRDFNLENDISHIRPEFLQFLGNAKIRFELATTDPKGNPTKGITRKKSRPILLPDWNPVFDNIKNSNVGGVNPWAPKKYLNIWVCDLNIPKRVNTNSVEVDWKDGVLGGVANPPKGLPNWQINLAGFQQELAAAPPIRQGVVIDFRFFGQNNEFSKDYLNSSPHYSYGRTTVHEVGHYLGLRHTWGDYGAILGLPCADHDDGIKDTPTEDQPFSNYMETGSCDVNINSCNVPYPGNGIDYPDMRENYMNYSTDVCYGMFTKEQVNMMRYALTSKRSEIVTKRAVESIPTPVKEHQLLEVSIHPNPAKDQFHLHIYDAVKTETKVQIFNSLGANIKTQTLAPGIQEANISVQNLAPGAYIIYIENGEKAFIKQVVKQ